jgi:hypothetical protein
MLRYNRALLTRNTHTHDTRTTSTAPTRHQVPAAQAGAGGEVTRCICVVSLPPPPPSLPPSHSLALWHVDTQAQDGDLVHHADALLGLVAAGLLLLSCHILAIL